MNEEWESGHENRYLWVTLCVISTVKYFAHVISLIFPTILLSIGTIPI